ncbi:MAG: TolC family protein [Planctomycetota bacterium]
MTKAGRLWTWLRCVVLLGSAIALSSNARTAAQDAVERLPSTAVAEPPAVLLPGSLSLADFEQHALVNHPGLMQARARVGAARGSWIQAGLYPNPFVGYEAEEMGSEGSAGKQGMRFGQEFVTAGKLDLARATACQEIVRAQQELAAQQFRVLTDVRTSYYRALVAQRRVELTDRLVQVAEQGLTTAEALLKAQEASRVDLLQTRVQRNTTRILAENARHDARAAWQMLTAVAAWPDRPPQPLSGEPTPGEPLSWEESLSRLISQSPEMAAADASLQQARWNVQLQCARRYPNVDTAARVQQDTAENRVIAGVEVGLALPLFDRNQGNILRAESEVVAAQRNIERLELALQARLAEAFREYSSARTTVEQYRDLILPDAGSALELVATAYRQGEVGYLDLLTAQRTYFESNLLYLDALLELKTAEMSIEGLLLRGALEVDVATTSALVGPREE